MSMPGISTSWSNGQHFKERTRWVSQRLSRSTRISMGRDVRMYVSAARQSGNLEVRTGKSTILSVQSSLQSSRNQQSSKVKGIEKYTDRLFEQNCIKSIF